jgi:hypothetical protein
MGSAEVYARGYTRGELFSYIHYIRYLLSFIDGIPILNLRVILGVALARAVNNIVLP